MSRGQLHVPGIGDLEVTDEQLLALASAKSFKIEPESPEMGVLRLIAFEGPYYSIVTLATEMNIDPPAYPLLESILWELNTNGWITFGLQQFTDMHTHVTRPVVREWPINIKVTRIGGDVAGMRKPAHVISSSRMRQDRYGFIPPPKGKWVDYTRFYHHGFWAHGSPIERMPFVLHCAKYPDHPHQGQMDPVIDETKPKKKEFMLPSIWAKDRREEKRVALIAAGDPDPEVTLKEVDVVMSIADVAREIMREKNVGKDAAYAQARKLAQRNEPPLQEGMSRKDGVLEGVYRLNVRAGVGLDGLTTQLHAMGVHVNDSELTAYLWDLQKQGLVVFKEGHSSHGSTLGRIRLTSAGTLKAMERRGDKPTAYALKAAAAEARKPQVIQKGKRPEVIPSVAYVPTEKPRVAAPLPQNMKSPLTDETDRVGEAPASSASADASSAEDIGTAWKPRKVQYRFDGERFPLLAGILRTYDQRKEVSVKAAKIVEAAAAVSDVDPEAAEMLMKRAEEMENPFRLTQLEIEVVHLIEEVTK